ncbi:hypothetical protein GQ43DRAFT_47585 [Delitschia confertaspora ATCC 74209]|uniref:Nascent polypeptide-associated complex subunit alpha-like UBA domain-containing protein n=1 Tax=Delitschia confertaspora ATCC 74209 TaxID=1513339 RepID=A0A9P4JMS8_9PLEO|nr:hypothetical protein GQ43DRAFT_47585 [Delitschia confertaspora ATCC 74209]
MAEEPQPPTIHEGASAAAPPVGTAEDRKTAAALSSLDANDDESGGAKKDVDTKALGEAMKNLNVEGKDKGEEKKASAKKVVKIDATDVNLLMDQVDLSKAEATDLLRAHDGDSVKAMVAIVTSNS